MGDEGSGGRGAASGKKMHSELDALENHLQRRKTTKRGGATTRRRGRVKKKRRRWGEKVNLSKKERKAKQTSEGNPHARRLELLPSQVTKRKEELKEMESWLYWMP